MKIHLAQISPEGLHLQGEDPVEILEFKADDINFHSPINYDVVASNIESSLLVQGQLWTNVMLRCGRCLKNFEYELRANEFVVHRPMTGEELVDLTSEVREDILLQLPAYPVCAEQCKGLCTVCGKDLNKHVCQCERAAGHPAWSALDEALRTLKKPKKRQPTK